LVPALLGGLTTLGVAWGIAVTRKGFPTSGGRGAAMLVDQDRKVFTLGPSCREFGFTLYAMTITRATSMTDKEIVTDQGECISSFVHWDRVFAIPDDRHVRLDSEFGSRYEFQFGFPLRSMWGAQDNPSMFMGEAKRLFVLREPVAGGVLHLPF